jgi:soluble lytic murein transglycosylase-like protein
MTLAWIPYARGRPAPPPADRPFVGRAAALLIPLTLIFTLGLVAYATIEPAKGRLPTTMQTAPVPVAVSVSPALPPQFSPPVQRWSAEIHQWSAEYQLPAAWIATVMQIESCGNPRVHSRAGAAGLFQVMPFHFAPDEDPLDVSTNARRGLAYLARSFFLANGDPAATFAGYNGGHGVIARPPVLWPEETQRYALWATGIIDDVGAGLAPSPTLSRWLDAGGDRLCRLAAEVLGLPTGDPALSS